MKNIIMLIAAVFVSASALAGFAGHNNTTSLGLFNAIKCSTGMTCSKSGDKLQLVSNPNGVLHSQAIKTVSGSVTVAQCGYTLYNSGAVQLDLPTVSGSLGCRYTFVTGSADNFDINPQTADRVQVLTDAAGDKIRNATIGSSITLEAVPKPNASGEYIWVNMGSQGTWSDAN